MATSEEITEQFLKQYADAMEVIADMRYQLVHAYESHKIPAKEFNELSATYEKTIVKLVEITEGIVRGVDEEDERANTRTN